jgi:predicted CopG family antitoxin
MASRTVALDEEAYELLKHTKRPSESFSEAVKRLARPRRSISEFAGMWADLSKGDAKKLRESYASLRRADQRRDEKIRRMWS